MQAAARQARGCGLTAIRWPRRGSGLFFFRHFQSFDELPTR